MCTYIPSLAFLLRVGVPEYCAVFFGELVQTASATFTIPKPPYTSPVDRTAFCWSLALTFSNLYAAGRRMDPGTGHLVFADDIDVYYRNSDIDTVCRVLGIELVSLNKSRVLNNAKRHVTGGGVM